jgi:hypothetical protein
LYHYANCRWPKVKKEFGYHSQGFLTSRTFSVSMKKHRVRMTAKAVNDAGKVIKEIRVPIVGPL